MLTFVCFWLCFTSLTLAADIASEHKFTKIELEDMMTQLGKAVEKTVSQPISLPVYGGFWPVYKFGSRDSTGDIDAFLQGFMELRKNPPKNMPDPLADKRKLQRGISDVGLANLKKYQMSPAQAGQWLNFDMTGTLGEDPEIEKFSSKAFKAFGSKLVVFEPNWFVALATKLRLKDFREKEKMDGLAFYSELIRTGSNYDEILTHSIAFYKTVLGHEELDAPSQPERLSRLKQVEQEYAKAFISSPETGVTWVGNLEYLQKKGTDGLFQTSLGRLVVKTKAGAPLGAINKLTGLYEVVIASGDGSSSSTRGGETTIPLSTSRATVTRRLRALTPKLGNRSPVAGVVMTSRGNLVYTNKDGTPFVSPSGHFYIQIEKGGRGGKLFSALVAPTTEWIDISTGLPAPKKFGCVGGPTDHCEFNPDQQAEGGTNSKGLFSGRNLKASLANLGSKFNLNGSITADEKKAFKTALIEDDFFYKSKAVKEEDKYSEQHFNEMLPKFQPYLEKVCLNAKSMAFSKLIKAHKSEFIDHSAMYYLLAEKDRHARRECKRPSIMAAASVLLGALDADGKTLTNKDLKVPLMKLLVSNLGSPAAEPEIDNCAYLITKIGTIPITDVPAVQDE